MIKTNEELELARLHKKQRWLLFIGFVAVIVIYYLILQVPMSNQVEFTTEINKDVKKVLSFPPSNERTIYLTRTKEIIDSQSSISLSEGREIAGLYEDAEAAENKRIEKTIKKKISKEIHNNM